MKKLGYGGYMVILFNSVRLIESSYLYMFNLHLLGYRFMKSILVINELYILTG